MKKLIFILALSVGFISCSKEDADSTSAITNVSSTYKVMIVEYTATWCPPCGTYGYPTWKLGHETHPYETGISMHPSDGVSDGASAAQAALKTFWGFSGTPSMAINNLPKFYPSTSALEGAYAGVKNNIAKAGIGVSHTLSGATLTINTKTVFFNDVAGDVYLAVYVVENDMMNTQSSQSGTVEHDHVFRGSANGNFGESLGTSCTKGKVIDGSYTFACPSDTRNMANLHVVCVLWTMVGGVPTTYINSNMD